MIIEVNKLLNQSLRISRSIPMGARRHPTEGVRYARSVDVDLLLIGKEREFKLAGHFSTVMLLSCHRCLAAFEFPMRQELDLVFIPRDRMPGEVDVELADQEMNIASYLDEIDICQIIDEQVALALPMKLLCSPGCRGMCQRCGRNLNEGNCECVEEVIDHRLLVLKDIKEKMFGAQTKKKH